MKRPRYSERFDYEDDESAAAKSSPRSSSPPAIREDGFEYDVFLSFRGADTRKGFTGHLYNALIDKGIRTFMDSEELEKGRKVEDLFGYIKRSKIFIPIFSKGYAHSKWCLREIGKIVECKRLIIPVFFDVEPTHVRHQTGPFANAFERHLRDTGIDREEVCRWIDALKEVGEISGYNLVDTQGDEAKLSQLIVKKIIAEVNKMPLFVAKYLVGLDSQIENVMKMLDVGAQGDTRMVGIHGMGGIGKTTLAKAAYNQVSTHFDACSFLSNIREEAKRSNGLLSLQKQLLDDILNDKMEKICSINHGIGVIRERIKSKKVLLVFDDVDDESQLDALAGSIDWFHSGSRIIITTRDKQVLRKRIVNYLYELKGLDATQSLKLFSWHAFGKVELNVKFIELSKQVVALAAGLPLALELFGSHFFDLETVKEWGTMLKKLKKDQHKHIHERLKVSYDVLDEEEKKVFLDIACFFVGKSREMVKHATLMWEDCEFFPDIAIKVLVHKSLISINDETGKFEMHDHIRDMGRKIIQDEGFYQGSRLWEDDMSLDILQNKKGTESVEAIQINNLDIFSDDSMYLYAIEAESFATMPKLRMLQLGRNVTLEGQYERVPKMLRWLQWKIPGHLRSLPDALCLENIVVLDLSWSSITQVWNPRTTAVIKELRKLKVLKLVGCKKLTSCPDFKSTHMPHLQQLDFEGCDSLLELHPSIGSLKGLTRLNLSGCTSLKKLPKEIGLLKSLTHLNLKDCRSLKKLPEEIYELTSLEELDLSYCLDITNLPSWLGTQILRSSMCLGN